jgi:branched-chain amino acid transport system ATP-binding protein
LRKLGVSVLLVEQNARAALQVADRAYVLEMGAVALSGTAQALPARPPDHRHATGIGKKADPLVAVA